METFCQIVQQCGGILPCVQIQDAPDMPNRGYYFDQTRGRVLKLEELKKIADRMCRYKPIDKRHQALSYQFCVRI